MVVNQAEVLGGQPSERGPFVHLMMLSVPRADGLVIIDDGSSDAFSSYIKYMCGSHPWKGEPGYATARPSNTRNM